MTERKFRKMLREHPDLISDEFVRSASESRDFVKASTLTPELIVQRARLHLDLPDETWAHAEQTLTKIRRRDKRHLWLSSFSKKASTAFQSHRRLAIASILILLVLAFFTFIPTGRALARSVFDYIVTVFDSKIDFSGYIGSPIKIFTPFFQSKVENEKPAYNTDDLEEITSYSSIEEFSQEIGKKPIQLRLQDAQCLGLEVINYTVSGLSVRTVYSVTNGEIVIIQKWLLGEDALLETNGEFNYSTKILDGVTFTYTIDEIDGVMDGIAILSNSVLWVAATSNVNAEEVLAALTYE